jgi:hypothetical protein
MKTPGVEPPDVSGTVYTWRDLRREDVARRLLTRIVQEGHDFEFDRMGHDEPLRERFQLDKAVGLWQKDISTKPGLSYGELILGKSRYPFTGFMVSWQQKPDGMWLNSVSLWAREGYFEDPLHVESFLVLLSDVLMLVQAGYGVAFHSREWDEKGWLTKRLADGRQARVGISLKAQEGLVDIFWANLFGPPYVRLFGRERLESCPKAMVRRLSSEAYLVRTSPMPKEWPREEVREVSSEVKKHLDGGVFFDKQRGEKPKGVHWESETEQA